MRTGTTLLAALILLSCGCKALGDSVVVNGKTLNQIEAEEEAERDIEAERRTKASLYETADGRVKLISEDGVYEARACRIMAEAFREAIPGAKLAAAARESNDDFERYEAELADATHYRDELETCLSGEVVNPVDSGGFDYEKRARVILREEVPRHEMRRDELEHARVHREIDSSFEALVTKLGEMSVDDVTEARRLASEFRRWTGTLMKQNPEAELTAMVQKRRRAIEEKVEALEASAGAQTSG